MAAGRRRVFLPVPSLTPDALGNEFYALLITRNYTVVLAQSNTLLSEKLG